jgi:hypothetical protein
MKSFDIAIYGHLSYDNIYEGFNYKTSVGCMGNVWNQLKIINPNLKVKLEPTDIGESLILADVEQCKRTSVSRLSLKTRQPVIHDARISHIMYLNEISDTSFIKELKGYVTADTCNGKPIDINLEALKSIDLLLIADEDIDSTVDLAKLISVVREYVVLHYPGGSTIYSKNGWQHTCKAEIVSGVNVLGAGDRLASYILTGLDNTVSIDKVIQEAHNKLTDHFKNEKI